MPPEISRLLRTTGVVVLRGTESLLTLRWRGMDSKFQFGDASPPPTAWAPSFRRVSGGSLCRRNSSIGLPRPTTARVVPPRRLSIGPNPTEASKPLPIWRGTEISNPFPSSGESDELPPEEESSQYNARRRWSVICKSSMTSGHWSEPDVTDGLGRHLEGPEDSMGRALAGKDA